MSDEQSSWVPVGTESGEDAELSARPSTASAGPATPSPALAGATVVDAASHEVAAPVVYRFDDTAPVLVADGSLTSPSHEDTAPLPATAAGGPVLLAPDGASLDEDAPWPSHAARHGIRLRIPTAVLVILLVAAGAFWGGAAVQKSRGGSGAAGTGAAASRFRSLFGGGAAGASGARTGGASSSFGGTSTAAATGTLTFVKGDTLYVTNASGDIVTVVVGSSTKVTRNATATLSALQPGDTVVVEGATAKDGTVTASSISATQKGVTSTGGFGGFGGAGSSSGRTGTAG